MYIGHLGVALAGKGLRRDAPLWLLVLATQGCDWFEVVACVGVPPGTSALWSHSIPAVLFLAGVLGVAAYRLTRDRGVALLVAAVTVSHLVADFVTGLKPSWPGGPTIGLDLYSHPFGDFAVESVVLLAGWLIYRRSLLPEVRDAKLVWLLLVLLTTMQLAGAIALAHAAVPTKCR